MQDLNQLLVGWLQAELDIKRRANPNFSLRAFAKRLSLAPSKLSEYLAGKRPIGLKTLKKIGDNHSVSATLRERIAQIILLRSGKVEAPVAVNPDEKYWCLANDVVHVLVMTWFEARGRAATCAEVAERFGIPTSEAREVIDRLHSIGLLQQVEGAFLAEPHPRMQLRSDFPAEEMFRGHESAQRKLSSVMRAAEPDARELKLMTLPLSRSQMPLVKAMVQSFFDQLHMLSKTTDPSDVYLMHFGMAPVASLEAPTETPSR